MAKKCSPSDWDDSKWRAHFPANWRAQTMGSKNFSAGKAKKFTGQKQMGALLCSPKPDHWSEGQMLTIGQYWIPGQTSQVTNMISWAMVEMPYISRHLCGNQSVSWLFIAIHPTVLWGPHLGKLGIYCRTYWLCGCLTQWYDKTLEPAAENKAVRLRWDTITCHGNTMDKFLHRGQCCGTTKKIAESMKMLESLQWPEYEEQH